ARKPSRAEPLREEVRHSIEREDENGEHQTRRGRQPPTVRVGAAVTQDGPPRSRGRRYAQAEETQACFGENDHSRLERGEDEDRSAQVWDAVTEDGSQT